MNGIFTLMVRLNTPWNPLNWAGRGLVDVGEGRWLTGLFWVLLTLGLARGRFPVRAVDRRTLVLHRLGRDAGGDQQKEAGRAVHARAAAVRPASRSGNAAANLIGLVLPAPVRAIIRKDFMLLPAGYAQPVRLVTPLIFGVLYTIMFLRPGGGMFPDKPDMPRFLVDISHFISTYGNIGMSLFVGWMLLTRLSGMAFSSEGKNYWMLKASPVRTGHLLTAKFLVAYLPTLALGLVFLVAVSIMHKVALPVFLYSLLATAMCQAGMNGILLAFGVMGANFNWTDPRRMNAGAIGCLGQFLTVLFLPVSFGLFIGPLLLASILHWPQVYGYLAGGIVGTAVAGLCAILPPWLVRTRVERLGEN